MAFNFVDLPPVARNKNQVMTDLEFVEREISRFKVSQKRREMLTGDRYFKGIHDVLWKKRQAIGEDGELIEVKNLPNNRIIDNQYRKMVRQKVNYLVGQPITFQSGNKQFANELKKLFGKKFMKLLKRIGTDAENEGIVWVYPTYDDDVV